MATMTANETERVARAAEKLADLTERERELVSSGRLIELTQLVSERQSIAEELDRLLPKGQLPDGELRDRVVDLNNRVRRNLALLLSVRDELSRALRDSQQVQRAVEHYTRG